MGTFQQVQKDSGQQAKKKNAGQPAQVQQAQKEPGPSFVHEPPPVKATEEHWYDKIHMRGYTQIRTGTTVVETMMQSSTGLINRSAKTQFLDQAGTSDFLR